MKTRELREEYRGVLERQLALSQLKDFKAQTWVDWGGSPLRPGPKNS